MSHIIDRHPHICLNLPLVQVYLAHMMLEGRGGPRDDNGAVRLLHLAAAKGQTEGMESTLTNME